MILLSWVRFIPWYDIGDIMVGAACGAGNAYPSRAPNFTSGFHRGSCCHVICVSLFHVIVLAFGFWVLIVPFVWLLGIYIFSSYPYCFFFQSCKLLNVGMIAWFCDIHVLYGDCGVTSCHINIDICFQKGSCCPV